MQSVIVLAIAESLSWISSGLMENLSLSVSDRSASAGAVDGDGAVGADPAGAGVAGGAVNGT